MNFIINLEIYPLDIMVSVDENTESLIKKLSFFDIDEEDKELIRYETTGSGRTVMFKNGGTLIRLDFKRLTKDNIHGVIAHEIFHAVEFIMNRINIKLRRNSDEAYAYLIQYITNIIYKKIELKK